MSGIFTTTLIQPFNIFLKYQILFKTKTKREINLLSDKDYFVQVLEYPNVANKLMLYY
jgi:hypothetical protein